MKNIFCIILFFVAALLRGANIPLYSVPVVPATPALQYLITVHTDGVSIVRVRLDSFAGSNDFVSATQRLESLMYSNANYATDSVAGLQVQITLDRGTNAANTAAITALTPTISDLQARADSAAVTNNANTLGLRFVTNTLPPIGSIIAWAPSLTNVLAVLDTNIWQRCDGQIISDAASILYGYHVPDLNGALSMVQRFLRGGATSGGTGGADTHSHDVDLSPGAGDFTSGSDAYAASSGHVSTADASSLPSYYEVVWLIRVR